MKANADVSDRKLMTDDHVTKNLTKSLEMTDDITMTQNFLDVNKNFKPEEHEQALLDETKNLGGQYSTFFIQALKSHGMTFMPDTKKHKRIMDASDFDTQLIMDSSKMVMNNNILAANTKDKSGKDLFDKARAAKKTYNKAEKKYQRGPSKRYKDRAKLEVELMGKFSEMHNVPDGGRANEIDPRQVMHIMHIVSGGKGMKGNKLESFMRDLGGSDMEKKKPILDMFFKNMSNETLNFDKGMMDEKYIMGNIDKVQNFMGGILALDNMKKQRMFGYKVDDRHNEILDKSGQFGGTYSTYVQAMLNNKFGLKQNNTFNTIPDIMVKDMKGWAKDDFVNVKDLQKQYKKPWWKLW